ncbi:MAG: hypothetical protein IJO21_06095 [Oscillospiraceae bacterium]|nr:hypothetical protein [Oscillospiraceae bacterium]MBQ7130591.1 hypothetical protein [Oscillospiraceae bacterium]
MAENTKKDTGKTSKKKNLIDPLYQKYTKSVIRALGSTEFYEFFMDAISKAENEFQFSNRKLVKTVDLNWVDAIEDTLQAFQNIISNPRNIIREDELIVNVANAKKAGADVVRHLSQHASLVDKFDEVSGDVRPNRLMQKYREDSWGLYENRIVFTSMEMAQQFVKIRHDALFSAMSDEFGAKLKVDSTMESATEMVHTELFLHIKETDSALTTDEKNKDVFERISRAHRVLSVMMNSQFAQQMAKLPRVKGSITKTNILKKNPNYRKALALMEYLRSYDEIGYTIRVVEQNPEINEKFQQDIYHNILFNYLILKGYLEDEKDRAVPTPTKTRKRALKPKFIKEIIEELTEDYDLPDVEIRKVLIEELTKEQLMLEEAAERRRLVEEQERRKKEEAERIRLEKEAEKERIRKEKEAEKERLRQEKEAEEERLRLERMERESEDRRRCKIFQTELTWFQEHLDQQLQARIDAEAKKAEELKEFEDAARLLEEAEARKLEAEEREKKRLQEEKERIKREKQLAIERAKREEEERLEKERLAKLAEEERLRKEEEERQEKLRREQDAKDTAATKQYHEEIVIFLDALPQRLQLRREEEERIAKEKEQRELERQRRLAGLPQRRR